MNVQLAVTRTDRQRMAWEGLADPTIKRLMYGGAKGGGKSWFLVVWLFCQVWSIMAQASLEPSNNPPHVAWFGRKQATDLTQTTLQTWREVIPEEYYKLKGGTEKDPKHILIADRIAIDYGGLDKQESINKFNSAEYIIIAVDQAEEVTREEMSTVRASLRMVLKDPKGKPIKIPFKELYTANPRQCWLKDDFIVAPKPNVKFIQALPTDNPFLPADYVQTLQEAFEFRPELLEAYLHGNWDALEGADQIIKGEWIRDAGGKKLIGWAKRPRLVVDTARFGDDETVIMYMITTDIEEQWIMSHCRTIDISSRLAVLSRERNDCPVVVESTGADLGAGVIDELTGLGVPVVRFSPASKVSESKYYNERAKAWCECAKKFAKGEIQLTKNATVTLINQLCTPSYKFRNGKTLCESKEDIKKRLGRSPDRADTFVIGQWAYERVPAVDDDWVSDEEQEAESADSYIVESVL